MRIWNRLRYLVNRRRLEQDLAEELRIHAEMVEDELRRAGLPQTEAGQGEHGAEFRRFPICERMGAVLSAHAAPFSPVALFQITRGFCTKWVARS